MKLVAVERWDPKFFADFAALRNRINRDHPAHLDETPEALASQFGEGAPFARGNDFKAWLALDEQGRGLGRIVASAPNDRRLAFACCGFFECERDPGVAHALFSEAERWARDRGFAALKGPINGGFFYSYRLKLPGGGAPFYGEPAHPDYYHALFEAAGFAASGRWSTIRLRFLASVRVFLSIARRFKNAPENRALRIRPVDLSRWKEELRTIHRLFHESYAGMPEFMPVPFDEFEALYDSFKHLIHPKFAFFVENHGKPVGFQIGLFDPQPILKARDRMAPGKLRDAIALLRLKLNRRRLLVMYVGKVPESAGGVKGVTGMMSKRVALAAPRYGVFSADVCYLAEGSPTFASLPKTYETVSRYVVYEKKL